MSTRSFIAVENVNGTFEAIYCHWDGYPENQMPILREHYKTFKKARKLLSLGFISYLAPNLEPPENVLHSFSNPCKGVVLAYHRDRGDEKESAIKCKSLANLIADAIEYSAEHLYILTRKKAWEHIEL